MVEFLINVLKAFDIDYGFFRLINYVTFRALIGAFTSLVLTLVFGHKFIVFLYKKRFRDTSGDYLSIESHSKRGTPTAGGLIILFSTIVSIVIWGNLANLFLLMLILTIVYFSFVGFIDDFLKTRMGSSLSGLGQLTKTMLILFYAVPFSLWVTSGVSPIPVEIRNKIFFPFIKSAILELPPFFYSIFLVFFMFSVINAVNITDGLDGLASGISLQVVGVYGVFGYIIGNRVLAKHYLFFHINGAGEIAVFSGALLGAIIGFLWYNVYPAEVFMGDTGSLSIGASISVIAIFLKQEFLFLIVGGVFVFEIFTSLIQEKFGYRIGRRIFYRAPYHHTLIYRGVAEPKAVTRLVVISAILSIISLLSIKIR